MNILVAPNSYKECASSSEAADLIQDQLFKRGFIHSLNFPLSDGGDGFLEVCRRNDSNLQRVIFKARNCYNHGTRRIPGAFDKTSQTLILEAAEIIGLKTIPEKYRKPEKINSENLGLFLHQLQKRNDPKYKRLKKVIIGIGGTGTSDLGLGLCKPFGLKLFDAADRELPISPQFYARVMRIVLPQQTDLHCDVVLDVEAPLFGKDGTSRVFAKQKGADRATVNLLERGVRNILSILQRYYQIDLQERLYGAGGGLVVGLSLIANIHVSLGRDYLLEKLRLDEKVRWADVVITGEGKYDQQSFMKKATGIVSEIAQKRKKQLMMIVGTDQKARGTGRRAGIKIYELSPLFSSRKESIKQFKKGIRLAIAKIADELCSSSEKK